MSIKNLACVSKNCSLTIQQKDGKGNVAIFVDKDSKDYNDIKTKFTLLCNNNGIEKSNYDVNTPAFYCNLEDNVKFDVSEKLKRKNVFDYENNGVYVKDLIGSL